MKKRHAEAPFSQADPVFSNAGGFRPDPTYPHWQSPSDESMEKPPTAPPDLASSHAWHTDKRRTRHKV